MSTSHQQILRSTSIIGGASVINVLISLLRTKIVAVVLGPAGLGLISLYQNLVATASAVSAMGFGNVGTRQIAEAASGNDVEAIEVARRALSLGTLILAVGGGGLFWLLRSSLAQQVLGDQSRAEDVGWLALGVALTVAAGSQSALLNGLRRVGDFARVSVLSAFFSTIFGVAALWLWDAKGLLLFVLAGPLTAYIFGRIYVMRLPKIQIARVSFAQMAVQWRTLFRLGFAFMIAGVVVAVGQLVVRSMVQRELGAEALGQFQASWMISTTYVGFVLTAMGTDYYPRLTAAVHDHAVVNRLVNEQTEVALLLAGPVFLFMLALTPWIIHLLYSERFAEAANVLRWQILGDVLKIAIWPMGYILLATGDGRTFLLFESLTIGIFVGLIWCGLPLVGVQASGLAFFGMYLFSLPLIHWIVQRKTKFAWSAGIKRLFSALFFMALVLCLLGSWSAWAALIAGLPASLIFLAYGVGRLGHMTDLGGRKGLLASASRRIIDKLMRHS